MFGLILAVRTVEGKPGLAGLLEAGLAGLADRLAASFMLVIRGHVADAGVQPDGVVVLPDDRDLGA